MALATPSGLELLQSSISGAEAITIGNSVFKSIKKRFNQAKTHTLHLGILSTIKNARRSISVTFLKDPTLIQAKTRLKYPVMVLYINNRLYNYYCVEAVAWLIRENSHYVLSKWQT
jgi:hypothetical protein